MGERANVGLVDDDEARIYSVLSIIWTRTCRLAVSLRENVVRADGAPSCPRWVED